MHLVLVRHGVSSANTQGVLAGRAEGVHLDERGRAQAESLVTTFEGVDISTIVGSPMVRCKETAEALCIQRRISYQVDDRLNEVDYGQWSGRALSDLGKEKMWESIQKHPTSVTFPAGESMVSLFNRTLDFLEAMRIRNEDEVVVAFSHGDVIKAVLAAAYSIPRDEFQRIVIDPAGISVIRLAENATFVQRVNDSEIALSSMLARKSKEATVGGEVA